MTREEGPPHRPPPPQAVESDDEDPNSPSDGYFSNSSHVPSNLLVPDPESQTSNKAREAESESHSPTSYRQPEPEAPHPIRNQNITYTPTSSSRSEDSFTESSPLLEEPPPMYEDAMAGRPRSDVRAIHRIGYGSTNTSNVGSAPFIPGQPRPPQSMADHPQNESHVYDEESALAEPSQQTRRGCFGRRGRNLEAEITRKPRRSLFKRLLLFLAGFLCVLWFIGLLLSRAHAVCLVLLISCRELE